MSNHQYSGWGERRQQDCWQVRTGEAGFWVPDRSEIITQFFTRYLFFALALIYFSTLDGLEPGMGVFAQVQGDVFLGMAPSFAVRYRLGGFDITAGDVFFGVLWVALVLYVYILMGRIRGAAPPARLPQPLRCAQPPRPAGGGRLHLYRCKSQQTDAEGAVAYYGTLIDESKTA